jgi:hypothetical protein
MSKKDVCGVFSSSSSSSIVEAGAAPSYVCDHATGKVVVFKPPTYVRVHHSLK